MWILLILGYCFSWLTISKKNLEIDALQNMLQHPLQQEI